MQLKKMSLVLIIGVSFGGLFGTVSQPAHASDVPGLKSYKTIPKVLRGTWRAKGYKNYYRGKRNANWAYSFNKNSYAEIIRVKGKKTKKIKFPHKDISEIGYEVRNKRYHVIPKVTKKNYAYASFLGLRPVTHHGKKALALDPMTGDHITYLYKVK